MNGGYFLKANGKKVQIHGSFRNYGNYADNYGIPYCLDYETGEIYQFYSQKIILNSASTASNILGLDVTFVFFPDDVLGGLPFASETSFSLTRHL